MTSHRPYLLRALYEWIADNGMTPHILVDAQLPGVRVPPHTVKNGRVVLNIAERAVSRLELDNESVRFSARFGGMSHPVMVPVAAVMAIYARETGQGMALPEDIGGTDQDDDPSQIDATSGDDDGGGDGGDGSDGGGSPAPKRGGHLRIVK